MSAGLHRGEDRTWHAAAVKFRKALEQLDWPVPRCLPGEPDECGGTDAEHAASYLGALAAVVEFRTAHLHFGEHGGATIAEVVYASTREELAAIEAARPCGRGEH